MVACPCRSPFDSVQGYMHVAAQTAGSMQVVLKQYRGMIEQIAVLGCFIAACKYDLAAPIPMPLHLVVLESHCCRM